MSNPFEDLRQAVVVRPMNSPGPQGAAGPELKIQYSYDGQSWHDDPLQTDRYLRFSTDNGVSWSDAVYFNNLAETLEWVDKARQWAINPENREVEPGEYSALHYATRAARSEVNAEAAALDAAGSATEAFGAAAPAWDSEIVYNYNDVVSFDNGHTYRCIGTNVVGTDHAPNINGVDNAEEWTRITVSPDGYFEIDEYGDYMPMIAPISSEIFMLDENGDITYNPDGGSEIIERIIYNENKLRNIIMYAGDNPASITIYYDIPIITSDLVIPSNVSLYFKENGKLSPANGITLTINGNIFAGRWQIFGSSGTIELYNQTEVYPEWFGAKHDGITDDTIVLQKCAESTKEGNIILGIGEYKVNGQITIPKDVNLIGQGMDVSIINAEGATGIFPNSAVVYNAGYISPMSASLGLTINKGTTVITFDSSHGLSAGDVFFVYNPTDFSWSMFRQYYKAGEYYQVLSVISDTEVEITSPSYDIYQYTDVDLYKLNGTRSILKNFTVIAPGPGVNGIVRGVTLNYSHNALIENVKATNSDNATMYLSHSYESSIKNAVCIQTTQDPGFGTQYGLVIGNSQNCDIQGFFVGVRHGLTLGGGAEIPACTNRGILIHDSTCKNQFLGIAACDMHGNTENCTVDNVNCFVGGINVTGHNNKHRNINIYMGSTDTDNVGYMAIFARELKSMQQEFSNINITVPGVLTNPTQPLINIGETNVTSFSELTTINGTIVFNNINIDAPLWDEASTKSILVIRNRGSLIKWGVVVNGLTHNCNNTSVDGINSPYAAVSISTVSGSSPDFVHVNNVVSEKRSPLFLSSNDINVKVKGLRISGKISIPVTSSQFYAYQTVTFPFAFPKDPYVVAQVSNIASEAATTVSFVSGIGKDYANIGVKTTDPNITFANQTIDVYWIATLDEE